MSPLSFPRPASLAVAAAFAATLAVASSASAHTTLAGESLWSIAQANGVSVYALAAANGRGLNDLLLPGDTLVVPAPTPAAPATSYAAAAAAAPGMVPVSGPAGTTYLPPSAAANFAALRRRSLAHYGVDLYPAGALSGYRTYAQQAELYRRYQLGLGPVAAPPGTSAHELGRALDLASPTMRAPLDALGPGYGWRKIESPGEWWHVSYVGG